MMPHQHVRLQSWTTTNIDSVSIDIDNNQLISIKSTKQVIVAWINMNQHDNANCPD